LLRSGTEFEVEADLVIPALGFDPVPCPQTESFRDLAVQGWGGIVVDEHQMTTIPGVFAGGDIVQGPSLVLHAVRDARRAAEQIHSFLSVQSTKASTS
jgi:glutamate synthase (NADPH/NADH) small chain